MSDLQPPGRPEEREQTPAVHVAVGREGRFPPRARLVAVLLLLLIGLVIVIWFLLRTLGPQARVTVAPGGITYVGEFPSGRRLANPLGLAWTGRLLCVAESE